MYQIKTFKAVNPMFVVTANMTSGGDWYVSIDNTQSGESLLRLERASEVNFNQHMVMIDGYSLRVLSGSTSYLTHELRQLVLTAIDYSEMPAPAERVGQIVTAKLRSSDSHNGKFAQFGPGDAGVIVHMESAPPIQRGGPQETVCTVMFGHDKEYEVDFHFITFYRDNLTLTERQPHAAVLEAAQEFIASQS